MRTSMAARVAVALILLTSAVCSAFPLSDSAPLAKDGPPSPKDLPWPYGTGVPGANSGDGPKGSSEKQIVSGEEEQEEQKKDSLQASSMQDSAAESSFSGFKSIGRGKYGYGLGKHEDEKEGEENKDDENELKENENEDEEDEEEEDEKEEKDEASSSEDDLSGKSSDESDRNEDESGEEDLVGRGEEEDDGEDKSFGANEDKKVLTRGYYRRAGYIPPHFRVATSVTSSVSAVFSSRNRNIDKSLKKELDEKKNDDGKDNEQKDDEEDGIGENEEETNDEEEGGDEEEKVEKEIGNEIADGDEIDTDKGEENKATVPHPFFTIVSSSLVGEKQSSVDGRYKTRKGINDQDEQETEGHKNEEQREEEKYTKEEDDEEEPEKEDEKESDTDDEEEVDEVDENEDSEEDEEDDVDGSSSEEDSPAFIILNNDKHGRSKYGGQNFKLTGNHESSKVRDDLLLFLPVVDKTSSSVSRVRALSSKLDRQGQPLDLQPAALGEHIEGYVTNLDHEDTAHFIGELTKVLDDSGSIEDDEIDVDEERKGEKRKDEGVTFPGEYPEIRKKMTLSPGRTGRTFTVYRRAHNSESVRSRAEVPSHFRIPGHRAQSNRGATSKILKKESESMEASTTRTTNGKQYNKEFSQTEENNESIEIESKPETIIITARPIYPSSEMTTEQPKPGLTKEKIREISQTYSDFLNRFRKSRGRSGQSTISSARVTNLDDDTQSTENKSQLNQSSTVLESDSSDENVTPKSSLAILESMHLETEMLEKLLQKISARDSNSSNGASDEQMSESMELLFDQVQVPEPVLVDITNPFFNKFLFSEELEDPNLKIISVPMPTLVDIGRVATHTTSPSNVVSSPSATLSMPEQNVMYLSTEVEIVDNSDELNLPKEKVVSVEENTQNRNSQSRQLNAQNIHSSEVESAEDSEDKFEQFVSSSPTQLKLIMSIETQSPEISAETTITDSAKSSQDFAARSDEVSTGDSSDLRGEDSRILSSEEDDVEDVLTSNLKSNQSALSSESSEEELVPHFLQQYGLPKEEFGIGVSELLESEQGNTHISISSTPSEKDQIFNRVIGRQQLQPLIAQSFDELLLHTQPRRGESHRRSEQNKRNDFGNQQDSGLIDGQSRRQESVRFMPTAGRGVLSRNRGGVHKSNQLERGIEGSVQNTFAVGGRDVSNTNEEESSISVLDRSSALLTSTKDGTLQQNDVKVPIKKLQDIKSGSGSLPEVTIFTSAKQHQVTEEVSDFAAIGDQIDNLPGKQVFRDSLLQPDHDVAISKSLPSSSQKDLLELRQPTQSQGKSLSRFSQMSSAPQIFDERSREMTQEEFTAKLKEMIESQSKKISLSGVKHQTNLTDKIQNSLSEQAILSKTSLMSQDSGASVDSAVDALLPLESPVEDKQTKHAEDSSTILPLREQLKRLRERTRLETPQLSHDSQFDNSASQQNTEKVLKSQREEMQSKFTTRLRDMIDSQSKQLPKQSIHESIDSQRQMIATQTRDDRPVQKPPSSVRSEVDVPKQEVQFQGTGVSDIMTHVSIAPSEFHIEENATEISRKLMQKVIASRLRQRINEQSKVTHPLPPRTSPPQIQRLSNNGRAELSQNNFGKEIGPLREQMQRQFTARLRQMVKNQTRVTEPAHSLPITELGTQPQPVVLEESHGENDRLPSQPISESSSLNRQLENQGLRKVMQSEFTARLRQMVANQTQSENARLPSKFVTPSPKVFQRQDETPRQIIQSEFTTRLREMVANQTNVSNSQVRTTSGSQSSHGRLNTLSGTPRDIMQAEFTARLKEMIVNQTKTNTNHSQQSSTTKTLRQQSELPREMRPRNFTDRLQQIVANQTTSKVLSFQINPNQQRAQTSTHRQQVQGNLREKMQTEFTAKLRQMVANQTQMAENFQHAGKFQTIPVVRVTGNNNEHEQTDVQRQLTHREFNERFRHMMNTKSGNNLQSQPVEIPSEGEISVSSHQASAVLSGESQKVRLEAQQQREDNRGGLENNSKQLAGSQIHAKQQSQLQSQQKLTMHVNEHDGQVPMSNRQNFNLNNQRQLPSLGSHKSSQEKRLPTKFLISDIDGKHIETISARQLSPDVLLSSLSDGDVRVSPSEVLLPEDDELQMPRIPARQMVPERLLPNLHMKEEKIRTSTSRPDHSNLQASINAQIRIPDDTIAQIQGGNHQQIRNLQQHTIPGRSAAGHTNWQSERHGPDTSRNQENTSVQSQNIRGREEVSEQSAGKAIGEHDSAPFIEQKFVVKFKNIEELARHQEGILIQQTRHRTQTRSQSRPLAGVLHPDGRIHSSELLSDRRASVEAMQALGGQSIAIPAARSERVHVTGPNNGRKTRPQTLSVAASSDGSSFRTQAISTVGAERGHFVRSQNTPATNLRNIHSARQQNTPQQTMQLMSHRMRPQNPTLIRQQSDFVARPLNEPANRTQTAKTLRQQNIENSARQNLQLHLPNNSLFSGQQQIAPAQTPTNPPITSPQATLKTRMRSNPSTEQINFPTDQIRLPVDQFSMGPLVTLNPRVSKARQFTRLRIPGPGPFTGNSKLFDEISKDINNPPRAEFASQDFTPKNQKSPVDNSRQMPIISSGDSRKLPDISPVASSNSPAQFEPIQMALDMLNKDIQTLNALLNEESVSQLVAGPASLGRGTASSAKQLLQPSLDISELPKLEPEVISANVEVRSPSGKLYTVPRTFLADLYEGSGTNPFGDPTLRVNEAKALLEKLLQRRHQELNMRTRRAAR